MYTFFSSLTYILTWILKKIIFCRIDQFICFFNFLFSGKNTILKEIIIFWQNIFHYWKKKYGCWILNCMNCICYCRCCLLYRHQDGYASYKRPAHVRLCVPRKQRWTQSQYHFHWVCISIHIYVCKGLYMIRA